MSPSTLLPTLTLNVFGGRGTFLILRRLFFFSPCTVVDKGGVLSPFLSPLGPSDSHPSVIPSVGDVHRPRSCLRPWTRRIKLYSSIVSKVQNKVPTRDSVPSFTKRTTSDPLWGHTKPKYYTGPGTDVVAMSRPPGACPGPDTRGRRTCGWDVLWVFPTPTPDWLVEGFVRFLYFCFEG